MKPDQLDRAPWWVKSILTLVERLGISTVLVGIMLWILFGFVMRDMNTLEAGQKDVLASQVQHRADMNAMILDGQVNSRLMQAQMERMVRLAELQCVYLAETNPQKAACLNATSGGVK